MAAHAGYEILIDQIKLVNVWKTPIHKGLVRQLGLCFAPSRSGIRMSSWATHMPKGHRFLLLKDGMVQWGLQL